MVNEVVRIAAATPEIRVAECDYNAKKILALIKKAKAEQVQLLVLPELCITGATCGDLFHQQVLRESASKALRKLVDASKDIDVMVVVGLPLKNHDVLYNAAAVFFKGKVLGFVPKDYGHINFESNAKYFYPPLRGNLNWYGEEIPIDTDMSFLLANDPNVTSELLLRKSGLRRPASSGFTIGVTIGNTGNDSEALGKAAIIANLSASLETVGSVKLRRKSIRFSSGQYNCTYIYANAGYGESTTDKVFSGHNIIAQCGEILEASLTFGDGWAVAEVEMAAQSKPNDNWRFDNDSDMSNFTSIRDFLEYQRNNPDPTPFITECEDPEHALNIQAAGLARRIDHIKGTAVIGISGGLDSCLALLVTVRAYAMLGKPVSEIVAVTMPCFGTTTRTKTNAHRLCEALGITCREIDITASVRQHLKDIGHPGGMGEQLPEATTSPENLYDTTFENAQARMRYMLLMNLTNQVNGLVVGTGSLSELALGWATYNGDHMSMYSVNAGVPKTLVRHLVEYIAVTCGNTEGKERLCRSPELMPKAATRKCRWDSFPPERRGLGQSPIKLKKVLDSILATRVSPELLPALNDEITQITEDLVGPYELHDFFIYSMLNRRHTPKEIFALAKTAFANKYEPNVILHWQKTFYRRFFSQQFKRSCLPDAPQVVSVSLSPRAGFKMPSDASAAVWLRELDSI